MNQTVSFDVDVAAGNVEQVNIDVSVGNVEKVSASLSGSTDIALENTTYDSSADEVRLNFSSPSSATTTLDTVDVVLTHDLSSVKSPANGLSYTISAEDGAATASPSFDLVGVDETFVPTPVTEDNNDSIDVDVFTDTTSSATTSADNVTYFVTNGTDTLSGSLQSSAVSTTAVNATLDLSPGGTTGANAGFAAAGEQLTLHVVGQSPDDRPTSANGTVFQTQTTFTIADDGDASTTGGNLDGSLYWIGQEVEVDVSSAFSPGETIDIRSVESRSSGNPSTTGQARSVTVGAGGNIIIDTDRFRGEGFYVLRGPG
ncbi:hypothetical protein ABNG03_07465 [Halorubrum sp. RMP-47]|uniref:Uncharacterized protein n=1 Tax=Halorubrum miltondacostae TaxID=3076378 RepID=A0ABD5M3K1_9EURY